MVNSLEKIHTFSISPESLSLYVNNFMKEKPVHIQWRCTWIKDNDYYYPTNIVLEKVWRDPHPDDEIKNLKTSWEANELDPIIYEYFNSGLYLQASIIQHTIEF